MSGWLQGNPLPLDSNGAVPINSKNQTGIPVDFFFSKLKTTPTTVAVATAVDDYTVELTSTVGCEIGDYFGTFNADDESDNRAYFGGIAGVASNVITLDTPIDFAFQIGDTAACFNRNMAVDGSSTTQTFAVEVGSAATQSIAINRIVLSMICASAVNLVKFGDLTALTRGLVLRRVNGVVNNIWNVKTNGEIQNLCYDYDPHAALNPVQGQDGVGFRYSLNGPEKHGVIVLLEPGDRLELIVQDNLLALTQLRVIAEGSYVTN